MTEGQKSFNVMQSTLGKKNDEFPFNEFAGRDWVEIRRDDSA